jgi:hypothetical protein
MKNAATLVAGVLLALAAVWPLAMQPPSTPSS